MSEIIPKAETVFQATWRRIMSGELRHVPDQPDIRTVFVSERHGIMAFLDPYCKFRHQVLVAPREGTPGIPAYFHDLPETRMLQLQAVSNAIGKTMLSKYRDLKVERLDLPVRRPLAHVEGYGVDDHVHSLLYLAERAEGANLYLSNAELIHAAEYRTSAALDQAQEFLRLEPGRARALEHRLRVLAEHQEEIDIEII